MAAVYPSITIERSNGNQRLVTTREQTMPAMSNWRQHSIPGFKEVLATCMGHEATSAPTTPRDLIPRSNSLVEFRMDQRPQRTSLAPQELRLNTGGAYESATPPMYTFHSARSASGAQLLSPQLIQTPIEPISASSSTSTQSMRSIRARQTRKLPSSRPAAKRMRDTRDREGAAIQQMETDLEAQGCLADLKPLNANNKEEAGRRYPKADVLERYCELSNGMRHRLRDESHQARRDSRKCQAYQQWVERWCVALNPDAREQLDAMIAEAMASERQSSATHSFDSSASYSTRSSVSDSDRRSPSSAEWSPEDHDFAVTAALPHRPIDHFQNSRL